VNHDLVDYERLAGFDKRTRMAEAEVVALKGLSNTLQIVAVEWD